MKYKKMVNWDTLTPEEADALNNGDKTEEDLISEWDKAEQEEREAEKAKLAEEAAKAKEIADNYKIRAEKAEKRVPKDDEPTPTQGFSQSDVILLARADVHDDDIDEVIEYARYKKISVKDALNSPVMKSLISERNEERKTAEATATGNSRAGTTPTSGNDLLKDAASGKVPESDEEISRLVDARFRSKK